MQLESLLQQLSDGQFHSGQALADRHGVSRTAIWKQISALAELGLNVERVRGQGYRIPGGIRLLDAASITSGLSDSARNLLGDLCILRHVDSTNLALRRGESLASGRARVVLSEMQTDGRGRHGRRWQSPFARNVYLSMDWRFDGGVQELEGLSLALGVVVADALAECGAPGVTLKWPNDLLHEGRKLGGILVEISGDAEGPCEAIIGIGLNVDMRNPGEQAPDQPWSDAITAGWERPDRNRLVAALLNHCLPMLATYAVDTFSVWQQRWMARDAFSGQPVELHSGSRRLAGVARGVDVHGALLLETAQGIQAIGGGEVSLRRAERSE